MRHIGSIITFPYKIFLLFLGVILLGISCIFWFLNNYYLGLAYLFGSLIILRWSLKIKQIKSDGENVYIIGFKAKRKIKVKDIKSVNNFFLWFYIESVDNKKHFFLNTLASHFKILFGSEKEVHSKILESIKKQN